MLAQRQERKQNENASDEDTEREQNNRQNTRSSDSMSKTVPVRGVEKTPFLKDSDHTADHTVDCEDHSVRVSDENESS